MALTLVLVALCALITVLQRLSPQRDTPRAARWGLACWGTGYLLTLAVRIGLFDPGGPVAGASGNLVAFQVLAGALNVAAGLLLWSGVSELAFFGEGGRGKRIRIGYAGFIGLLAAFSRMPPVVFGSLAAPLLAPFRWRDEVRPLVRFAAWLFGLLAIFLGIFSPRISGAPEPLAGLPFTLQRFANLVTAAAVVQAITLVPRLLSGRMLVIRRIGRRLALSHFLVGAVPLALALIFWGIGSYLSVGTERAQSAVRMLETESARLERTLHAAAAQPGETRAKVTEGLRRFYPTAELFQTSDSLLIGGQFRAAWPDSLPSHGVVVTREAAFVGAVHRAGPNPIVALVPADEVIDSLLSPALGARLRILTATHVSSKGGNLTIGGADPEPTEDERPSSDNSPASATRPTPLPDSVTTGLPRKSQTGQVSGAALAPVLRAGVKNWSRDRVLLTAHVPWKEAAVGLLTGIRENPFALVPLILLGVVALLLGVVENLTLRMVVALSKSVTAAVGALKRAAEALQGGDLAYRIPIRPEDRDELWDVAGSFNSMAAALEVARESERERERLEKELQLARQIQARLLPSAAPSIAGLDLAGLSVSAQEVGGDYYDFLPLLDGRVGLVIADVSGKGVSAALLMSAFRASLLSQALGGEAPGELLERLNRFLHRSVEPGRFVTAFLALIDPKSGRMHYSNAGHNPPQVWPERGGDPQELTTGGFMLGAFAAGSWESDVCQLAPGDLLILYTDGVTEAQDDSGEFWGEERLAALLEKHRRTGCSELAKTIVQAVRSFEGNTGPSDDITLLLARRRQVPAAVDSAPEALAQAAR